VNNNTTDCGSETGQLTSLCETIVTNIATITITITITITKTISTVTITTVTITTVTYKSDQSQSITNKTK